MYVYINLIRISVYMASIVFFKKVSVLQGSNSIQFKSVGNIFVYFTQLISRVAKC